MTRARRELVSLADTPYNSRATETPIVRKLAHDPFWRHRSESIARVNENGNPRHPRNCDANGNQTGWKSLQNGTHRTITWDENNRIVSIADNGHTTRYVYDASGRRIIKRGPQGETVYVNKFFTVRNRTIATKSIFVGKTRLASKLSPDEGQGGPTTTGGSGFLPGLTGIFHRSQAANQNALNALKNPHLTGRAFPGQGLGHRSAKGNQNAQNVNKNPNLRSGSGLNNVMPDGNFLYFYHPDHLGSTAYVTDGNAKLFEHMEYFPFGETWVDQHSNTQRVPYLFTGKEYDETTGLYYFGARYYDPRTSVWESADPGMAQYLPKTPTGQRGIVKLMPPTVQRPIARYNLPGNGGVFTPANMGLYGYVGNNPMNKVDPNGLSGMFGMSGAYIEEEGSAGQALAVEQQAREQAQQAGIKAAPKFLEAGAVGVGAVAFLAAGQEEVAVPLGRFAAGLAYAGATTKAITQGKVTTSDVVTFATATLAVGAGPIAEQLTENPYVVKGADLAAEALDIGHGAYNLTKPDADLSCKAPNKYKNPAARNR